MSARLSILTAWVLLFATGAGAQSAGGAVRAGDIIGRVIRNSAEMEFVSSRPDGDRAISLVVMPGTIHKLLGIVGAKVSVGGAWLLTGTVLFPLNSSGIKPAATPVIGVERAF
jgi:hypothetical protein